MPTTAPTAKPTTVSPIARAQAFAQATRQHKKPVPSQSKGENDTMSFTLPKVRLLSSIKLLVEAQVKVTHATNTTYTPSPFAPYPLLRNIAVDVNNGFAPFKVGGRELSMYNMTRHESQTVSTVVDPTKANRGVTMLGTAASPTGATNTVRYIVDLPITLNERDPIGLVLLQNEETVVTITVDTSAASNIVSGSGYTTTLVGNITVTPLVETFSIPASPDAFPDLSVLKLVNTRSQSITMTGTQEIALPTGQTYRKIILYFEDANGVPMKDTDFTGNIELVFNQSDTPYSVQPKFLSAENETRYGAILPDGMYVFDFTYQGLANYGGARDYIDTEKLTEFWVRFNAPFTGKVTVVYETITRLKTN